MFWDGIATQMAEAHYQQMNQNEILFFLSEPVTKHSVWSWTKFFKKIVTSEELKATKFWWDRFLEFGLPRGRG